MQRSNYHVLVYYSGVALGHIIVIMRPEEWACGYCHGRGACGKESE
jgi:hypothetical protein